MGTSCICAAPKKPARYTTTSSCPLPSVETVPSPRADKVSVPLATWQGDEHDVAEDYDVGRILGRGAYAVVNEAVYKPTKTQVALKTQHDIFEDLTTAKRVLREICLLRRLRHPCVVKLQDVYIPNRRPDSPTFNNLCIAFEQAATSVDKLIKSPLLLDPEQVRMVVYNIITGMNYIYSAGVIHRDLKPANILINSDCSVKICDFGLARTFALKDIASATAMELAPSPVKSSPKPSESENPRIEHLNETFKRFTMHVSTRWYRAPEVILKENYGPAVDVWAVGCILGELLSMINHAPSSRRDRLPLFPGRSSIGYSPLAKAQDANSTDTEQLDVIFGTLGTPSEEDRKFITNKEALKYINSMPMHEGVDFAKKYPAAGEAAIDLLRKMLAINPEKRYTIAQCMQHPYFNSVREPVKEMTAAEPIVLAIDDIADPDENTILQAFFQEINYYTILRREGRLYTDKQ